MIFCTRTRTRQKEAIHKVTESEAYRSEVIILFEPPKSTETNIDAYA
jgi:hypothetical protein